MQTVTAHGAALPAREAGFRHFDIAQIHANAAAPARPDGRLVNPPGLAPAREA